MYLERMLTIAKKANEVDAKARENHSFDPEESDVLLVDMCLESFLRYLLVRVSYGIETDFKYMEDHGIPLDERAEYLRLKQDQKNVAQDSAIGMATALNRYAKQHDLPALYDGEDVNMQRRKELENMSGLTEKEKIEKEYEDEKVNRTNDVVFSFLRETINAGDIIKETLFKGMKDIQDAFSKKKQEYANNGIEVQLPESEASVVKGEDSSRKEMVNEYLAGKEEAQKEKFNRKVERLKDKRERAREDYVPKKRGRPRKADKNKNDDAVGGME
jgi:hypothetical protein